MSLRWKTLLIFAVALAVLIGLVAILGSSLISRSFEDLERRTIEQDVERARAALTERIASLNQTVSDWAPWDDSYDFVTDGNAVFVETNLNPPSLANLALNLVVYADLSGRVVFGTGFDLETEELRPLDPDVVARLAGPSGLAALGRGEGGVCGVLLLPDGIELVAAQPIVRSDRSGPVRGTLIMGRPLDESEIAELGESLRVRLSVHRRSGQGEPTDVLQILPGLSSGAPTAVRALDDNRVAGYALVDDVFDLPGIVLRLELPREIHAQGQEVARYLLGLVAIAGGAITVLGFLVLFAYLGRLSRLEASVAEVGSRDDPALRVQLAGRDELSRLADSINRMLEARAQSQGRLRESEERYRQELEIRVRERTAELVQLNRALEATTLEMERARDEADRASKAKSEFLSRISHELRTPLNAVLGFGQLLRLAELSVEQRQNVDDILKAGRHLLQLVDEVLDIARIESGRMQVPLEPVAVAEVLGESIDLLRPTAERLEVKIAVPEPGSFSHYVLADRRRLAQVLLNLLSNAVKYAGRASTVTVRCDCERAGPVRISVADDGPGIPVELHHRLFVPFDRLGAERTETEGIGLGLALSKRFMEAMGGSIGFESEPGRGSTFWIELPSAEAPDGMRVRQAPSLPPELPATEGRPVRTVLYVDEDPVSRRLVERMLALRPDLRLVPAGQGQLALDLLPQTRPDALLVSAQLPDMTGLELVRRLRAGEAMPGLPVVVVGDDARPFAAEEARAAGAQEYLTKPISVARLHRVLARFLDPGERGEA